MKKLLVLLLAPVVFAGCSTVSNLTPSQVPRTTTGLYTVEAKWSTHRQAVREDSITPVVMVGTETYPMQPVALVKDRWETVIPVPADKDSVKYRFKFNYKVNAISQPKADSTLSPEYRLIDK